MNFQQTAPNELCRDCRKGDQTRQLSEISKSQSTEFLAQVYSDWEGLFPWIRQEYWYYISFFEEITGFIDVELLEFEDDALAAFKNNIALRKKRSSCQLNVLHTDGCGEQIGKI